jgi:hypothetical protein
MCLGGRCIARLKFPDDSSGTIVLEKLADEDQQLIHCFAAFVMKKIADGNPIHSDWQNLAEITEFQEFKVIGYASYYNAWCHWYNVSCNETYNASYTASNNALDNDRDTDRFDLNNDNGITTVVIPSEPSRLGNRFSSLTDDLFNEHVGIDSRLSASADDLNSRQSSSVVDCCVDPSDSDNGIAVVVAADTISTDPEEATVDPLDGEENAASGQVKPRSESSRLDSRQSRNAGNVFKYDDGIPYSIPSEPPGLSFRLSHSTDECDNGIADSVPREPPGLGSHQSRPAHDAFEYDDAIADSIPSEPPGLDSRLSRSADECDDRIVDSIPSEPPGLSSCQSHCINDVLARDDGITDSTPSEPAGLGSRPSASVANLFGLGDDTLDALDGKNLPDQVNPIVCFNTGCPVPSGLGSHKFRSNKDLFRVDDDDGIADSIPGEPTGLGSRLSASVADIFGLGADTLDPLDGEYLPDQVKPMSRSSKDLFDVDDDDDGITEDSTQFRAGPLNSDIVSRIRWKIDSVSATTMDSRILLSRYQASLLNSALDSLLMMKTISSISTCRGNSWGAVQEDPSEPKHSRLGSRLSRSADEYNDGIADTIPIEPPELRSRLSSTVGKVYQDSWGAVQEDSSDPEADPVKPSDSRLLTSSVVDCHVVLAFGSDDDHVYNDGIADSIPSEPPEEFGSRVSSSTDDLFEDDTIPSNPEADPVKPSDSRLLTSSVVDCRVVLAFGSDDDHGINADANAVTVDHRTVMIDHRMIRGAVTTTVMRQMRTLTYEETRVVRSTDECDDGIVDSIPNEPPDISTTTVCLLRFIRINSGEKLAAKTLPFVHVPGAINLADMLSKHWGHQQTWTQLQALLFLGG